MEASTKQCKQCPQGTFNKDTGFKNQCSECEAGKFSAAGSATCTECEAGKFKAAGSATWSACGIGYGSVKERTGCGEESLH